MLFKDIYLDFEISYWKKPRMNKPWPVPSFLRRPVYTRQCILTRVHWSTIEFIAAIFTVRKFVTGLPQGYLFSTFTNEMCHWKWRKIISKEPLECCSVALLFMTISCYRNYNIILLFSMGNSMINKIIASSIW